MRIARQLLVLPTEKPLEMISAHEVHHKDRIAGQPTQQSGHDLRGGSCERTGIGELDELLEDFDG